MSDAVSNNRGLKRLGIVAMIVVLAVVAFGLWSRSRASHALVATAQTADVIPVVVTWPARPNGCAGLTLPANVQAYNSAPIFARTNGYIRRWFVDIGDPVHTGQTLAVLEAPEVDQQLAQARAQYQTAVANQRLAKSTAVRWEAMLAKDAVSKQETDEKNGDLAAKSAVANAAAADVRRLQALSGFSRLIAPFDGTVTSRTTQIGALVTAGSNPTSPLFTVSDVHRVRIYVRVPQAFSSQIKSSLQANLTVPEYPTRTFPVTVTRTAGAVDPQSGTMLVELQADNRDRALKPGSYGLIRFPGDVGITGFRVPGSAVLFNDGGNQVVVVGRDNKVRLVKVNVARDEGKTVIIDNGLNGSETIVDTPPDAIQQGDTVKIVQREASGGGAGSGGAGSHG